MIYNSPQQHILPDIITNLKIFISKNILYILSDKGP